MSRRITVAAAAVALGLTACGGSRPPPEPVVGPTGYVYPIGTPPVATRFSQTATLYIRTGDYERALELGHQGITEDPGNAVHYLLAGMAYLRLEDFQRADEMFKEAQRIFPAYELDIEPQREAAWGLAFNEGLAAYAEGDLERTIRKWSGAILIYSIRPEAHRNLANLYSTEGRYEEAIEVYREAIEGLRQPPATQVLTAQQMAEREDEVAGLEEQLAALLLLTERHAEAEPLLRARLARDPDNVQARTDLAAVLNSMGRESDARAIYSDLLTEGGLQAAELFNLGVGLFRVGDFPGAVEAFRRLTRIQPQSRDAWFNYANALFAIQDWPILVDVGERLLHLDPLGQTSMLLAARAQLELESRDAAVAILERVDAAPVYVGDLSLRRFGGESTVQGVVTGNVAEPDTPVRLRFEFYGDEGIAIGSSTMAVGAPPKDEEVPLYVSFPGQALSYRYEVVGVGATES